MMTFRIARIPRSFVPTCLTFDHNRLTVFPVQATVPYRAFYERYREGDKRYAREVKIPDVTFRDGVTFLQEELNILKEEWKEKLACDPKFYQPGDTDIVWDFDSQEKLNNWKVTSDKDNNDGFSECEFVPSESGTAIFRGILSTRLPKDGIVERTGYCNITAKKPMRSFMRKYYFDWSPFTHLVLRIRGDGRSYLVNLHAEGSFDVNWHDIYSFILHTRGGPYWQTVKLPFSRFFLTSKGAIQDKQYPVPLFMITTLGITCADKISGNFQLEIDHIGVHFDGNFTEEFAYEMYTYRKYFLW